MRIEFEFGNAMSVLRKEMSMADEARSRLGAALQA